LLEVCQTRDHLSVMSGVTPAGQLLSLIRRRALTGDESLAFLRHRYHYLGGKLLVIWDGGSIHRAQEVKNFLAHGWAGKIHLERFPAYAPELNPEEGVWQHLKHVELRNVCCLNLDHLNYELQLAIRRVRRKPELVQSFFAGAGLEL
jgi:transposase